MDGFKTLLLTISTVLTSYAKEFGEFCINEKLKISCPDNKIILLTEVKYGRMREARCITTQYGITGCSEDITAYMNGICSGRNICEMEVKKLIDVSQPCPTDLTNYLEVSYDCHPVAQITTNSCQTGTSTNYVELSNPRGYITTFKRNSPIYGSASCPWYIQVGSGQYINLTILDFSTPKEGEIRNKYNLTPLSDCPFTLIIEENGNKYSKQICTGGALVQPFHITRGNKALIHYIAHGGAKSSLLFLLKYEASGCKDLSTPVLAWVQRNKDNLRVQCNMSGEIWYLTCRDGQWIGDIGECKESSMSIFEIHNDSPIPIGLIIAIVIGIVLGIFIGICLLSIVFISRKSCFGIPTTQSVPADPLSKDQYFLENYHETTEIRSASENKQRNDKVLKQARSAENVLSSAHLSSIKSIRKMENRSISVPAPSGYGGNDSQQRLHFYEYPSVGNDVNIIDDAPPVYHELDFDPGQHEFRFHSSAIR